MAEQNVGLPTDTGNSRAVPSGQVSGNRPGGQGYYYGFGGAQRGQRRALNPLQSVPARQVIDACKKKLNEYLRDTNRKVLTEQEDPPMLLVLIECMNYTLEPLRTDANHALQDAQVQLATSQPIQVQWKRVIWEAVPWEVRTFPFAVARMLLQQIQHYVYALDPITDKNGFLKSRSLTPEEVVQVSPKPFRKPTQQEIDLRDGVMKKIVGDSVLKTQKPQSGGGPLTVNLDPESHDATLDGNAPVAPSKDAVADGYRATQPGVGNVRGSTSMPMPDQQRKEYNPEGPEGELQGGTGLPEHLTKRPPPEPTGAR